MTKTENIVAVAKAITPFLPVATVDYIAKFIVEHDVHFTIAKKRKTKLGDYRQPFRGSSHKISVNGNLNKYAFLVTTVHEMAHLTTFVKFGNRVMPHGQEWKAEFKLCFDPVFELNILPEDVEMALQKYLRNAKASSCADEPLYRVLRRYDKKTKLLVEHLAFGATFQLNGKIFVKGKKLRKRYECKEFNTSRMYRVLGLAEIDNIIEHE
ncbi:SprT-like domain-containing protein [Crocinitomix catalasitica]|uniref:SprT-like domain-containing protein n=1 Tax=Crocinitomix catalasitica TaxID=184607 RepID=UPI0006880CB2|nr:SprT-like domain-containing protein [Crocinitomix catalasitica]